MAPEARDEDGRPPFFTTWSGAYWFVLGILAIEVALLAGMTWVFA